ncbi:aminoglycoside 6-adenylyltransferase [Rufibacter glacialis]|uniref:Aminoglycoside 6-adenylyltransferase n=1 Tax=Rufibacter glacialis TaxID=1259555 RepID=A0A5M8QNM2_9BACT|nr:aminoglycoside 6-adenylyltransferase [Rufibacter glacialis]KAA6437807.1 nucleotidyltransferase domain-containing protein [Rufibacter glacialis]GGK56111.1 oxalate:formate antiporter [Rufibacter glacialis]
MMQVDFAEKARKILAVDSNVIGLAVGGSWLTNELDEFSDLDLVLVTKEKVSGSKDHMLAYAQKLGNLLSGFTGEHVGEPRVLICLYDKPLLHVDIKFLTLDEFQTRVETPTLLLDPQGQLQEVLNNSTAQFPYPDYQWIEDRFWIWVHYALLKIGRGENLEAYDFFGFLRMVVFGPLLHIKNGNLPRGVRKVERHLHQQDLALLQQTIPQYNRQALLDSLHHAVDLYRKLRTALYENIHLQKETEEKVMRYFEEMQAQKK